MSSILGSYRALVEGTITPAELDETTKFQKYNLYNSNDAKKLSQTIRDAQGETDDKKAQALWKDALKQAKDLKAKASKIPPNDFGDWVIDLCLKPIWWFLGDVFISSARELILCWRCLVLRPWLTSIRLSTISIETSINLKPKR